MILTLTLSRDTKKFDEAELEEALQSLGFTKNDSKVLLTMAKYKVLSPADIAKYSGVDRARVYDSLNRLIEKGFIQKEPVKRGANYQIIPIENIFKSIREDFKNKIDDTILLEKAISELEVDQEESEPRVWSISSKDKIRKKIKDLISVAKNRIFFIITPDLLMEELGGYDWILKDIWNKKFSSEINVILALKYNEMLKEEIKKLLKIKVIIHSIEGDNVIPFGLLITDNDFLLTTLDQVKEAPEYTSGIWLENGKRKQTIGYEHLFKHFISSETKEIQLTTKKAQYPS
ncbi:MAG: TrmB family transcriptional regulator [Candidatus Lokiarchaeota archaeon]|nr:TrmB family transcriptional regulator [Candidatus Lokiarchaeota archaeon]